MIKNLFAAMLVCTTVLTMGSATYSQGGTKAALEHEFEAIEGGRLALNKWQGKVLLVVNTASFCGYTHQYAGLQALWERYEKRGLVLIGVPSNDFGGQEPNNETEIATFCQGAFGVTFPLTSKQVVSGPQAHPFYRWALGVLGTASAPRWNFHKYLIGRDGKLIGGYGAGTEPLSPEMISAIEAALGPT